MSKKCLNIEVIAPCSPYETEKLEKGIQCLKTHGHHVMAPTQPNQWAHGYLNGDASFRVNAIKKALQNSSHTHSLKKH